MTKISPEKIKNFYENNISFDRDITRFLTMKGEIITNFELIFNSKIPKD